MSDTPIAKKSFVVAFLVFLAVLIGINALQLRKALSGFDRWVGHEDHRLPNVRLVSPDCRWAVIDRFIELQPVENAGAFIFGDSQMFARGATQEQIFYTQWLGGDATVINFSFLAASIGDMNKIANALHEQKISAPILLQNINISHYIRPLDPNKAWPPDTKSSYELIPDRPSKLEKLYLNRPACAFRMRKNFNEDKLRTPRYRKLFDKFNLVPLKPYFVNFDKDIFDSIVPHKIQGFTNISETTILISAPLAYDQFDHYNYDANKVDEFLRSFFTLCGPDNPQLKCVDLTRSMTSEGFMDMIHMNARGHELLGGNLKKELAD